MKQEEEEIRATPSQAEILDRSKKLVFTFDSKVVEGYEGDTIASALIARGRKVFARSFKYHRPRGLLCVSGRCPNCMMNVDGRPNVRACTTPIRSGMVVTHQNAWPSLDHDVGSMIDKFSFLMPVGFYYKTFIHPKWAWPIARKIIRRITGIGKVNTKSGSQKQTDNKKSNDHEYVHKHVDVAVVGGGPAGIFAALQTADLVHRVLLVDDDSRLGGHLRYKKAICDGFAEFSGLPGFQIASLLTKRIVSTPNIEVMTDSTCFGFYEGNLLGLMDTKGERMVKVRAKKVIIATGSYERPYVFRNNDLPGIFLGRGLQRLINLYGVKPGRRVLVVTDNDYGYEVANDILSAGLEIVALADARNTSNVTFSDSKKEVVQKNLRERGIELLNSYVILEARGDKSVKQAIIGRVDECGNIVPGSERTLKCDVISVSIGFEPCNALLYQSGCKLKFDDELGEVVPFETIPDVYAAGEVTGIHDLQTISLQGKVAGLQASLELRNLVDPPATVTTSPPPDENKDECREELDHYSRELNRLVNEYKKQRAHQKLFISAPTTKEKRLLCICEDVTEHELKTAVEEGFDNIETLKRYTSFSMGPCQGKMCNFACTSIFANSTGQKLSNIERTTSRPPYQPVPFEILAGPIHMPVKLTPIHHKHTKLGANWMDHGDWRRPRDYGSVEQEYRAIRERVGMIDVSTLGRFEVKGKDSSKFLDMVLGHVYSTLKVGKARYASMFTEGGIVLDDGIAARLSEDEYLVTSSTTNAEFVEEYLKWWAEILKCYGCNRGNFCVQITNVTSGLGAINVAGPKAYDVLSKIVDIDLSYEAFPYMTCRRAKIGGVSAILLRIGFVGETGWEVHFPAEYGEYIWDVISDAGKEFGIRAVGVEAMKILRLEKGNIWVDIDTDRSSDALESGLGWALKFDKPDFVGKHYLEKTRERGFQQKLIGFVVKGPEILKDGDLIVHDGRVIGRVTSTRQSFTLQKCIGLGWVPVEQSQEGTIISVLHDGNLVAAEVVSGTFYDPEGRRLKGDGLMSTVIARRSIVQEKTPYRISPFHYKLVSLGAVLELDGSGWMIARRFTSLNDETRRTRESVSLADISHLEKICLKGKDALKSLEGKLGYGIPTIKLRSVVESKALQESSFPSASFCALTRDEILILSKTKEFADQVKDLVAISSKWDSCIHLTEITSYLAGLYIIGPKSGDLLSKLTEFNINEEEFPNLAISQAPFFHVQSVLLRRDLGDGLPAYQLYFDRGFAEYLWERVMEAGREFEIAPIGMDALRLLDADWSKKN
jgi:sarcosine oxidase subunit alpha